MQTEFRTILWRRGLSMMLFVLFSVTVAMAQVLVRGTVVDQTGESVIGASIQVKGTTQGTITDIDGKFSLGVPDKKSVIVVSFIGYATKELQVDTSKPMSIVLEEDTKVLDEVVVVGYQEVRKKDLTGSVAKADMNELLNTPVGSFDQTLGGRIAGVNVSSSEGTPGGTMNIVIRGNNSLTQDNSPLYVIDGFPVEDAAIASTINPSDIESLDILKDASATAIYGARGANGVVIITTKKGKVGKAQITYDGSVTMHHVTRTIPMMDAYEFVKLQAETYPASIANSTGGYLMEYQGKQWTLDDYRGIFQYDWQDEILRTALQHNHNIRLTGGTEGVRYNASVSYYNQDGILLNSGYERFQARANTVIKRDKLDINLTTNYSRSIQTGSTPSETSYSGMNNLFYSVWGYRPVTEPDVPLSTLMDNALDSSVEPTNDYRFNPIRSLKEEYRKYYINNLQLNGYVSYEFIKGLKLKVSGGYTYDARKNDQFNNSNTRYGGPTSTDKVNAQIIRNERLTWLNENTLTYQTNIKKKHFFNSLLGVTLQNSDYEYYSFKTTNIPNESMGMAGMSEGIPATTSSEKSSWSMMSYLGRVNYNYKSKYYATASFRVDGSSKFASGNQWGYFPSAAVAWRISSERFMEGTQSWLDDLKLRFSYGTAGNNNIPSGQMNLNYVSSATSWINGFSNYWAASKTMPNSDLKWETTITRNIGLDFTVLGGKLNGSIEAYLNTTKDLLIQFPVSGTGYDYQYRNMGETQNKGIEATLNWTAIDKKNFGLSFSANIGFNKNKIKDLGIMNDFGAETYWASSEIGYDFWIAKGGAVGKMYGYRSAGRYEVSDFEGYDTTSKKWILKEGVTDASAVVGTLRPGMMKLQNIDGSEDNKVTSDDREIIGDANPLHTGGFTINARAYGFDLSANFNWSYGNDVYNANKIEFTQTGKYQYRNMISDMADGKRWTNLNADGTICNDPAKLAEMNANTTMWSPYTARMVFSDWAVEDASFLRLNTLTLGYTLPKALLNKVKIQNLRFYVTGYNLFCITNYSGYDPEVSTIRKTNLTPGVDYSAYPKSRQFVIGVNLNF